MKFYHRNLLFIFMVLLVFCSFLVSAKSSQDKKKKSAGDQLSSHGTAVNFAIAGVVALVAGGMLGSG
ncbi:hypothetical protein FPQ18DRAFT_400152 [Pyronema domesticum]|uniref:Uncharacterized protein n=1 Tax=Pyronema omphalodes (strain CBS 100304) TaxID=1076935 RepID=U4LP30_PYROM|nr:hypothetical protein FPQ18DRAFT_400152 [Pyronema domesticum]CCX33906.1 Protein of unknown function [Pyronema omphalodes CBS 100304]